MRRSWAIRDTDRVAWVVARSFVVLAAVLWTACADRAVQSANGASDGHGESDVPDADTASAKDTPVDDAGSDAMPPDTGGVVPPRNCGEIEPVLYGCDIYQQDCPRGYRCTSDGFVGTNCFPESVDLRGLGEPCTGCPGDADNCARGLVCLPPALGTCVEDSGVCVPLCSGDIDNPQCEDPSHTCHNFGCTISHCIPPCDPLAPACDPGFWCDAYDGHFFCIAKAYDPEQRLYHSCTPGDCQPGLFCSTYLPPHDLNCDNGNEPFACNICQAFCTLDGSIECPEHETYEHKCVPWYGTEPAPPGLENLGRCLKDTHWD